MITQVRDSIVYRNGTIDTVKSFSWHDAWVNILGELKGRDVSLNVVSQDTIVQIVHRVPKKFSVGGAKLSDRKLSVLIRTLG